MEPEEVFVNELIQDLESGQLQLPTLPEVALRVRDVVDDEDASASQIAEIIAQDAALSARLIQVANLQSHIDTDHPLGQVGLGRGFGFPAPGSRGRRARNRTAGCPVRH
ncbi:MAG: HDOD domain-containing protein [Thiogranum sp.]